MGDPFHVRFQATPEAIQAIMRVLAYHSPQTLDELRSLVEAQGQKTTTLNEQLTRLRKLGLLDRQRVQLTDQGRACVEVLLRQPSLFYELLHFYHYALWNPLEPDVNRFSWTYRAVCRHLWTLTASVVDKRALLERLMEEIAISFPNESFISISLGTIQGVLQWIKMLQPSVYDGRRFQRRPFAPPELAVLGVDYLYRRQSVPYGELLQLDKEHFLEVATMCLVDDGVLDQMLKEAELRFRWFKVEKGWGYFVRLYQEPNLTEDL